ncbi:MAG: bifunctional riboflavin kinase/FAD synthetase [Patulibacter sp.]|nr:bifunctional riboflavin kinase/FAD synthetase [Patulibacter sp.]
MTARITSLADVHPRPRTIAIGMFDGVHRGHRAVIDGADTVVTFDPHPMAILRPDHVPPQLTSLEQKAEILGDLGVHELVLVPFTAETAALTAEAFVDDVIVDRLDARGVRIGENFRFGHAAAGTPELLSRDSRFDTTVVPVLTLDGDVVSSTRVRRLVAEGDVATAARLLGAPYALHGPVVQGEQRGRTLGFPTANLLPPDGRVLPDHGVYACRATVDGELTRAAAVSIGLRPQFESRFGVLVEAYLLDFDGDLYDRQLELTFLQRLRGEQTFASVDELIAQIQRDTDQTRRIVTV